MPPEATSPTAAADATAIEAIRGRGDISHLSARRTPQDARNWLK
jgi:hypothetical protein